MGSIPTLSSMELSPVPANVPGTSLNRKYAMYAIRLRQVVTEEGYTSNVLVHILQMIVRNRELFFSSR